VTFDEWYESSAFPSADDSVTARAAWDYQQVRIAELEALLRDIGNAAANQNLRSKEVLAQVRALLEKQSHD
jgi:hypothetical protein